MDFSLTDREASLMDILWTDGPSTVSEVRSKLADELAYTTVLTMLRLLESKGYVSHEEAGRAHRYYAIIDRDAAQRSALQALTHKLFQGSTDSLLTRLVADKKLSSDDVERIQRLIDSEPNEREKE